MTERHESRSRTVWNLADDHRPAIVQSVAKALCRRSYTGRDIAEIVAPSRELWQRMIPEAEYAVESVFKALDLLAAVSEIAPKGVVVPFALWDDLETFIYDHVDVVDGSYGQQRPNRAMSIMTRIEEEISRRKSVPDCPKENP